jgi:hypothetical protein
MSHARRIHLIYEPLRDSGPGFPIPQPKAIAVPDRPSYLTTNSAGAPRLSPEPRPRGNSLVVEPLYDGAQPKLLLLTLSPGGAPAQVNGRPAPRVAVLSVADQIRFDVYLLHVTSYNRPRIDPVANADPDDPGRCPMCSLPFEDGDVVYTCSNCPGRLHMKSKPRGEQEEVLRCATFVRECPSCKNPIDLEEGWSFVPDGR